MLQLVQHRKQRDRFGNIFWMSEDQSRVGYKNADGDVFWDNVEDLDKGCWS